MEKTVDSRLAHSYRGTTITWRPQRSQLVLDALECVDLLQAYCFFVATEKGQQNITGKQLAAFKRASPQYIPLEAPGVATPP